MGGKVKSVGGAAFMWLGLNTSGSKYCIFLKLPEQKSE